MDFIHSREFLNSNQYFRVDCDTQCNIQLMDDTNFAAYKASRTYRSSGGFFKEFPAILVPPCAGYWNVAMDLGGGSATIKYKISVLTIPG